MTDFGLLPCPFCGAPAKTNFNDVNRVNCSHPACYLSEARCEHGLTLAEWADRPTGAELEARVLQASVVSLQAAKE